jgi:PhoH-like ATPase
VNKKTFILDTNVILYDAKSIQRFEGNDIVIPLTVLEELNTKKKLSLELGKNARDALRFIDDLKESQKGQLHEGLELENGGRLRIYVEKKIEGGIPLSLNPLTGQHKIILAAYDLKQKGERAILVSKDFMARIKAETLGIPAEDYENLKFSYKRIYKGIKKIPVEKKIIDTFYKNSEIELEDEELFANEYCVLNSAENSSAIARYDGKKKVLTSTLKFNDNIWGIRPLNVEQRCALDLLLNDDVQLVTLVGPAGTGKTLLALAAGLRKVLDESYYSKILISRPIIPLGQDLGYLPGTKEEKLVPWMQPLYDNLEFLCGASNGESNDTLKWVLDSKKIEMEAVTYIRGRTLPRVFMIIDEAQNLTPHEMKTIISRAGEGTKIVLCGDPTQIDNPYLDEDSNGLTFAVGRFQGKNLFGHMVLSKTERSELAAIAADVM